MKKVKLEIVINLDVDYYLKWFEAILYSDIDGRMLEGRNKRIAIRKKQTFSTIAKNRDDKPLMTVETFTLLKKGISSGLESSKEYFKQRKKVGRLIDLEIKAELKKVDRKLIDKVLNLWFLNDNYVGYVGFFSSVLYIQYLDSIKDDKKQINEKALNLPQKIQLLNELGFFNLPSVGELREFTGKRTKLVSLLIGEDLTNTKKNINALNEPTIKFNPLKYEGILKKILE